MDAIRYGMDSLKANMPVLKPVSYIGVKPLYPDMGNF